MNLSTPNEEAPLHRELPADIFVGRQAILDVNERVWAYELRYGRVDPNTAYTVELFSVLDLSSAFLTAVSWAEASRVELSAA